MNVNSRTSNSARNLIMTITNKLIHMFLTFVGRQIFLQILSVEYLGINGLFVNVLTMLSLADLGLATAMSFSFYKPLADKDEDKLAALIGFYRKIYNIIAAFVAIVGLALTPFLHHIINLENEIPYIEVYYLIALSNTVISYLFVYKSTIITADQNSRIVTKYTVWTSILRMALQIAVLYATGSFMMYSLVSIVVTFANNLIISWKANVMYPFIKRKIKLDPADRVSIFANIKSMFIYKIATVIYNGTDNVFISALISTAVVGKYENYQLAVINLSGIAFMIFTSLTPSIGNLIAKEHPNKRKRVFKTMQTASYWIAGFFGFCLFFLLDDFVTLWLGREFVFNIYTKIVILMNFYLSLTLHPIAAFREATGIYQKTKFVMVAGSVIKVILAIIFGMRFGLAGIVTATMVSKLLTFAWYEPKILFRDYLGGRAIEYLFGHILNFTMLSACIAITYMLIPLKESSGWLSWIIKAVICAVCINMVYFIRYFKTHEFREMIEIVKKLLNKNKQVPQL